MASRFSCCSSLCCHPSAWQIHNSGNLPDSSRFLSQTSSPNLSKQLTSFHRAKFFSVSDFKSLGLLLREAPRIRVTTTGLRWSGLCPLGKMRGHRGAERKARGPSFGCRRAPWSVLRTGRLSEWPPFLPGKCWCGTEMGPCRGRAATRSRQGTGRGAAGSCKGRVAPAPRGRFRVGWVGELRLTLTLREGRLDASQDRSSSSLSPASRGEAAPSWPAASTSLTAIPGAPLGGWAQAVRGSSGSRSSSSSASKLPPPSSDASRPDSEDSAMASLCAFRVETGSEWRAARLWPRHRGELQPLWRVQDTSQTPCPPGGCPRAVASRAPPRANPAPARKGGGVVGGAWGGCHLPRREREVARWEWVRLRSAGVGVNIRPPRLPHPT